MKKILISICLLAVMVGIAGAVWHADECQCNQDANRLAMIFGLNLFQQCDEFVTSQVTFIGGEPMHSYNTTLWPHKQYFISGNENQYTAKEVSNGSCMSGRVYVTSTLNAAGDNITVVQENETYTAKVQKVVDTENIRNYVLWLVTRNCIVPISDWAELCNKTNVELSYPPYDIGVKVILVATGSKDEAAQNNTTQLMPLCCDPTMVGII
jgi:hypothetical protein